MCIVWTPVPPAPYARYARCAQVGSEAVEWLVRLGHASSRAEALSLCLAMHREGLLRHVLGEHAFQDAYLFYGTRVTTT